MIGKDFNPMLKLKAAETKSMVPFVYQLFQDHMHLVTDDDMRLQCELLQAACKEAITFDTTLRENGRRLSVDVQDKLLCTYKRFNVLYDRAGGVQHPKSHLMLHLICSSSYNGNSRFYATYKDEEYNGIIAAIAKTCHKQVWYEAVFQKVSVLRKVRS